MFEYFRSFTQLGLKILRTYKLLNMLCVHTCEIHIQVKFSFSSVWHGLFKKRDITSRDFEP